MNQSPFIHTEPVVPPIFAGRTKELELINSALFDEGESLVLYGDDAIGKSSIVRTIHDGLFKNKEAKILPVKINAFDFIDAVEKDFLGITTHQICATIWTKVMNRKYSELLEETLLNPRGEITYASEEKSLKRIFRIVSSEKSSGSGKVNNELGGKFIFEGKLSQSNEISNSRKPLAPFEFLHLLDELNDIIASFGFVSIIVFCDELNHLPQKTNTDILRNYFSIFSSKKIQFVIISVNPEKHFEDDAKRLIDSFNYRLEIKTFTDVKQVDELLYNSHNNTTSVLEIEPGVSDYLFNQTGGHPWWIQKICDKVFKDPNQDMNLVKLDLEVINSSADFFKEEISIYNERIKAGLPFRKFNLASYFGK